MLYCCCVAGIALRHAVYCVMFSHLILVAVNFVKSLLIFAFQYIFLYA